MSSSKISPDGFLARPAENAALFERKEVNSEALPPKSPICVHGDSLHASRDVAKETSETLVRQSQTSRENSSTQAGSADFGANHFSPENEKGPDDEAHVRSTSTPTTTSSGAENTNIMAQANGNDKYGDDDVSETVLLEDSRDCKRPRESHEDDEKPAARRARFEEATAAQSCDNLEDVGSNSGRHSCPEADRQEDHSLQHSSVANGSCCGFCETCTDPFVCGKCSRCAYELRCVFSPCCKYVINDSTLRHYKEQAFSIVARDVRLKKQFEKIYGENGVITSKPLNGRVAHADNSAAADTTQNLCAERRDGFCGVCATCLDRDLCGKCGSCRGKREGRCAFLPCLDFNYTLLGINNFLNEAKTVKTGDPRLEHKFEKIFGSDGPLAAEVKLISESSLSGEAPRTGRGFVGHCKNCASCTNPIKCDKCISCRDTRKGRCVFALCLAYKYKPTTLANAKQQAKSIMKGNKMLERQFDQLYGSGGVFSGTAKAKAEPESQHDRKVKSRCGHCASCTAKEVCQKCAACRGIRGGGCVFYPCLNYKYKESTIKFFMHKARAVKAKSRNTHLEEQFERMYGKLITVLDESEVMTSKRSEKPHSHSKNSCDCSACCSPFFCKNCVPCKAGNRCVFNLCKTYAFKKKTMSTYKGYARQALYSDNSLKSRFKEFYGANSTKVKAEEEITIGTRVFARWHENDQWYNGTIVAKRGNLVDIFFDDGDERNDVPDDEFVPLEGLEESIVNDLYVSEDEIADKVLSDTAVVTTRHSLKRRGAGAAKCDKDKISHFLVNKGYYREWISRDGRTKAVYGKIESCTWAEEGPIQFNVILDLSIGQWFAFGVRNEAPNPRMCNVEEPDAWSGYLAYTAQNEGKLYLGPSACPPKEKPFYRHYILPTTIHACPQQRVINLVVKGHHLQLKAKESEVPNGGLGLFITAAPLAAINSLCREASLVFEEGELVDLGVYGPLRTEDLKPNHVLIVKEFVHNWKAEAWSFGSNGKDDLVFDITDDDTGNLSKLAESNILVFTNETDGNETPSIFAKEDPEGAMHYYIGHSYPGQGRLVIPNDGTEVELKVDYGEKYESVRVRKGYSRLSGRQLKIEEKKVSTYEKDMLDDLNKIKAEEVLEAQNFLVKLNSKWKEGMMIDDATAVGRAMLVTLILLRRVMAINSREKGTGAHTWLVRSLHALSLEFFDRFDYATNRALLVGNKWYAELLSAALEVPVTLSAGDNSYSIRRAIEYLL